MFIIFFIVFYFILTISSNAIAIDKFTISPSLTFYNNYIFSSELQFDLKYITQDYFVGGYFKKSYINSNEIFDISNTKKYRITPIKTDDRNYFYGLFFKKHLLDFDEDKLYFTIFVDDVIKYNEILEFTYAGIYGAFGLQFDYLFSNILKFFKNIDDRLPLDIFLSISRDFDGMKNNILIGFNTNYFVSDVVSIGFGYNYFKDSKDRSSFSKKYGHRFYVINVNDLSYKSHNIDFLVNLLLNDVILNLKFGCSLSHDWGNGCRFGFVLDI